jgi:hypothetical protein
MGKGDSSGERPVELASALDSRISGSFRNRYEQELFRNTGQFPIANLLLELLLEGPAIFLAPDVYTLVGATLLQAWALTRWENTPAPRRFLGNLIGPATYTLIEALIEGWTFFDMPNHIIYFRIAFHGHPVFGARVLRPPLAPVHRACHIDPGPVGGTGDPVRIRVSCAAA